MSPIVPSSKAATTSPPRLMTTTSESRGGRSLPIDSDMSAAGTNQFTSEGTNREKKLVKGTTPRCQTMSVVMSPKGLNAPPALAATTTLMQATTTNFGRSRPTASDTAPMMRAVVRLSASGEMTNARAPVIQKIVRRLKPRPASCARSAAKTRRSSRVLTKVIAARRNSISSA